MSSTATWKITRAWRTCCSTVPTASGLAFGGLGAGFLRPALFFSDFLRRSTVALSRSWNSGLPRQVLKALASARLMVSRRRRSPK
ncbi:MAG: hypothetical protein U0790_01115 [Isosphaeraceae bacterium]